MSEAIEEYEYESVDDFFEAIRPDSNWWWEGTDSNHKCPWVFRGQFNKSWPLTPTAWRPTSPLRELAERIQSTRTTTGRNNPLLEGCIAEAEWKALKLFGGMASRLGFSVPHKDQGGSIPWLLEGLAPIAQHHGLPTRLLDWTEGPLEAAYFAVSHHWRSAAADKQRIAVFALRRPNQRDFFIEVPNSNETRKVWIIERRPIQTLTPNLQPQKSVFIMYARGFYNQPAEAAGLDELLRVSTVWPATPMLRVLSIGVEHADEIETRLNRHGINRLSLMPSLDNLVMETMLRIEQRA